MGAMNLTEYRSYIRTELSDSGSFFSDPEIDRAVAKTESLLSRLIPKKDIIETTIVIDRTAETLAIASSAGTTTYKPIKYDSETITRSGTTYVRDTDYTINYMTGVITEIDTQMPDQSDYAITYKQDTQRLDIGSLVTNSIKITRIEYPVGDIPPTYLSSYDLIEDYIIFHKDTTLVEGKHLRIYRDSKWTGAIVIPTVWAADTVIALNEVRRPTTSNATGFYYKCTARTGDFKTGVSEPTWNTVLGGSTSDDAITWTTTSLSDSDGEYPSHLDDAIVIGATGQCLIFKAEKYVQSAVSALSSLTAPTDYSITQPTTPTLPGAPASPNLPSAPSAPVAPTLSWADFIKAYKKMSDLEVSEAGMLVDAVSYLTTGESLITPLNVADRVAEKYAQYAQVKLAVVTGYRELARAIYDEQISALTKYAAEVASFVGEVNQYASEVSGTMDKYRGDLAQYASEIIGDTNNFRGEIDIEVAEVTNFSAKVAKYDTQTREQAMKGQYFLEAAGRYLASGQAKINEFYVMLGFKPELQHSQASTAQATRY